jgi:hypothetical protein
MFETAEADEIVNSAARDMLNTALFDLIIKGSAHSQINKYVTRLMITNEYLQAKLIITNEDSIR